MKGKRRDSVEQIREERNEPIYEEDVDEAVMAADDTGMIAQERINVETEIEEELEPLEGGEQPKH